MLNVDLPLSKPLGNKRNEIPKKGTSNLRNNWSLDNIEHSKEKLYENSQKPSMEICHELERSLS